MKLTFSGYGALVALAGCTPPQPARAPVDIAAEVNRCQATLADLVLLSADCPEAQLRADGVLRADPHCKNAFPDGKVDGHPFNVCKLVK